MPTPKTYKGKSMEPGGGGRFAKCVDDMRARGVKNPEAVCAAMGRKKYGSKQMAAWSRQGRARAKKKGR